MEAFARAVIDASPAATNSLSPANIKTEAGPCAFCRLYNESDKPTPQFQSLTHQTRGQVLELEQTVPNGQFSFAVVHVLALE